jgi:beta-N-acetylhexosaminidase
VATELLDAVRPGGVVLFARNVESDRQLKRLTAALHRRGIQIAIDQEGGRVNRLREIIGECPRDGRLIGQRLRELGVDINFAPVVDLEIFDDKVVNALRERCWGRTVKEVVAGAGKFLDDLQAQGVTGCLKHFPGLGGAQCDSHDELPTIRRSREQLLRHDLRAFRALLPQARAVMVGHGVYPALDAKWPASLSAKITTRLLRRQLGFGGLVFTDDLEMGAITQAVPFAEAVVAAVRAGADRLLVCHTPDRILAAHEALVRIEDRERVGALLKRDFLRRSRLQTAPTEGRQPRR